MKKPAFGFLVVSSVLVSTAAHAALINFATATATYDNLDPVNAAGTADPSGTGDNVIVGGATGAYGGPGIYSINDVEFDVHQFDAHSHPTFTGALADTVSVAGSLPVTYYVNYSINYNDPNDTLIVGGNNFIFDGVRVTINELTLTGPANTTQYGVLTATVSGVPESSTWAMMLLGFVGLGFAGYHRAKSRGAAGAVNA